MTPPYVYISQQHKTPPIFMGGVSNHINSNQNWVGSMCQISLAY